MKIPPGPTVACSCAAILGLDARGTNHRYCVNANESSGTKGGAFSLKDSCSMHLMLTIDQGAGHRWPSTWLHFFHTRIPSDSAYSLPKLLATEPSRATLDADCFPNLFYTSARSEIISLIDSSKLLRLAVFVNYDSIQTMSLYWCIGSFSFNCQYQSNFRER